MIIQETGKCPIELCLIVIICMSSLQLHNPNINSAGITNTLTEISKSISICGHRTSEEDSIVSSRFIVNKRQTIIIPLHP